MNCELKRISADLALKDKEVSCAMDSNFGSSHVLRLLVVRHHGSGSLRT